MAQFHSPRVARLVASGALVVLLVANASAASVASPARVARVGASASITRNWEQFFKGTSSAKTKIALLENGKKFSAVIAAQASSSLARGAGAKVNSVSNITSDSAVVHYTIDLDGQPALRDARGTAVRDDGTWKVSDVSFCALLGLEGVASAACPAVK